MANLISNVQSYAMKVTDQIWDSKLPLTWTIPIKDSCNHFLPNLKQTAPVLKFTILPTKRDHEEMVVKAEIISEQGEITIKVDRITREQVLDAFPSSLVLDVSRSVAHELTHMVQFNYDVIDPDSPNFSASKEEMKAFTSDLIVALRQFLTKEPNASLQEFLDKDWVWKDIKRRNENERKRVIRDISLAYRELRPNGRPRVSGIEEKTGMVLLPTRVFSMDRPGVVEKESNGTPHTGSRGKEAVVTDKQRNYLRQMMQPVVEEETVGGYDFILSYSPLFGIYQLGMQRDGQDFTDLDQQVGKIPNAPAIKISEFKPVLDKWLDKYGEIWAASHDERKNKIYGNLIKRLHYNIEPVDFMGLTFYKITK